MKVIRRASNLDQPLEPSRSSGVQRPVDVSPESAVCPAAPTRPTQRVEAVDIVRGFALFSVLAMNMPAFAGPTYSASPWEISTTWWDRGVEMLLLVAGESAFQSTFSFLFGLGFALQIDRALARGQSRWVFARRTMVLLGFGLVHALLIWDGDILTSYAVAGLILLSFTRASSRTLKRWAIGLAATMVVLVSALMATAYLADGAELVSSASDPLVAEQVDAFQSASFLDLAAGRLAGWVDSLAFLAVGTPWLLAQFLAGAWFVRSGRLAALVEQGPWLRRVLRISVPVAVVAKGTYGLAISRSSPPSSSGWGLGFYGRWGPVWGLLFTMVLFGLQILWSRWWLDRFRFGPLEWVWRTMTYGSPPPLRHQSPGV